MVRKTRERQLKRLAERRAAERRRRRRQRIIAGAVAAAVALAGIGVAGVAFLGGEEPAQTAATPKASPEPTAASVACEGEVPEMSDESKPTFEELPEMQLARRADYRATVETSCGTIELDLYEKRTPVTVNNFVFLAREGFYDGLTFHRVIPGFMAQGGDPQGDGTGGPGYQFEDEIVDSLTFDRAGLLAMANSGPDTNGSQFFITTGPAEHLNGRHTIFGEVVEGMDVLQEIEARGSQDGTPTETVYIEKVTIRER